MKYRVEIFQPGVNLSTKADVVAEKLEDMINDMAIDGWEFKSLQTMQYVARPSGCLAFLDKAQTRSLQFVVFQK